MIKNSHLVVVDVESTCWNKVDPHNHSQVSEIIEIGVAFLNLKDLTITKGLDLYVKPVVSKVSDFCTALTGITQGFLEEEGMPLAEAFGILKKLGTRDLGWASYGDYDRKMINSCGEKSPFSSQHLNIKMEFNSIFQLRGNLSSVGLAEAVEHLGLKFEGRHHNGYADARMTAIVKAELIRRARRPI